LQTLNYDIVKLFDAVSLSPYFKQHNHLLDDNPFIHTAFLSYFNEYYSVVYPNQFIYSIAHVHNDNDFWLNRTLMINHVDRQVEYLSMTSSDDLLSSLFNRSYVIPYRQQNEIYFQQNLDNFQQIKTHLNQAIFRPFKINIRHQPSGTSNTDNIVDMDFIIQNSTVCHIRFGSNYDIEYRRLIDENLSHMTSIVWQRERTHLMDNARLYHLYTWSPNEIDELISHGYSSNYTVSYRHDPIFYPDIIDDPTNVKFQMKI
jgi:hypothetical protein